MHNHVKTSRDHRKHNSQSTFNFDEFISKIQDMSLARKHRSLYLLLFHTYI